MVDALVPQGLTSNDIAALAEAAKQSTSGGAAGNTGAGTTAPDGSTETTGTTDAGANAAQPSAPQTPAPQAAAPRMLSDKDAATVQRLQTLLANAQNLQGAFTNLEAQQKALDEENKNLAESLRSQSKQLREMAGVLPENVTASELYAQFSGGMTELSTQYGQFHEGLVLYTNGVEALASNHNAVENGAYEYANGIESFAQGAKELDGGMNVLNEATITLPAEMQRQIDSMMADYTFPEFVPQSYMSADNKHTAAVQFVITTPAIEQPKAETEPEAPEAEPTVWDRFLSLFK